MRVNLQPIKHYRSTSHTGSSPSAPRPPFPPAGIHASSGDASPAAASLLGRSPSSASRWCGFAAKGWSVPW